MSEQTVPAAGGGTAAAPTTDSIGDDVDTAARAVPGVAAVYAARPIVARAVDHLARGTAALSSVQVSPSSAEATVSIGVELGRDSARVAEAVAARVRTVLAAHTSAAPVVRVRVSRLVLTAPGD
jgi:hypothetical protein